MARYEIDGTLIHIETDLLKATVATEGYTSGVRAGSLLDKSSGARDLGFGLSIVDFLLEPADPEAPVAKGQYEYGNLVHGNIPKRYVEGPQICTQARKLPYEVLVSPDPAAEKSTTSAPLLGKSPTSAPPLAKSPAFTSPLTKGGQGGSVPKEGQGAFVAIRQWYQWHEAYAPHKTGSRWEQLLIFADGLRYFLSSDRVTTVNASPALFLRIDMPGHLKHNQGDTFEQIYLSYHGLVPASSFLKDFPPDAHFHYRRGRDMTPQRFIRAYQVKGVAGSERRDGPDSGMPGLPLGQTRPPAGPWLAGMTLQPDDAYEAWCHQRGYVCFIEEIGGRPTQPGDTFGAAYLVGWFDDLEAMHAAYDRFQGTSGWELTGPPDTPTGYRPLRQRQLTPVPERTERPLIGAPLASVMGRWPIGR